MQSFFLHNKSAVQVRVDLPSHQMWILPFIQACAFRHPIIWLRNLSVSKIQPLFAFLPFGRSAVPKLSSSEDETTGVCHWAFHHPTRLYFKPTTKGTQPDNRLEIQPSYLTGGLNLVCSVESAVLAYCTIYGWYTVSCCCNRSN